MKNGNRWLEPAPTAQHHQPALSRSWAVSSCQGRLSVKKTSQLQTSPVLQGIDASKAAERCRMSFCHCGDFRDVIGPSNGSCFRPRPPILMNHGQAVRAKLRKIVVLSAHFLSSTNGHSCRAVRKISCSAHWIRSGQAPVSRTNTFDTTTMVQAQSRLGERDWGICMCIQKVQSSK